MANESNATPRPWTAKRPLDMEGMRHIYIESGNNIIGRIDGYFRDRRPVAEECSANADLIVRAVNCHDELVTAMQALLLHLGRNGGFASPTSPVLKKAHAALAKAKGESNDK